jgi:microcystin-dependent protein
MAQPYVGELRQFAGNFAPAGWAFCDGQLLPISENETLFQLIGTTYGGDGESTFAMPDLRGRIPLHMGSGFPLAQMAGVESVTLTTQQMPTHTHAFVASTNQASLTAAGNGILAQSVVADMYIQDSPDGSLPPNSIGISGGSQPHTNLQPYLCVNWIISLFGIFPSPT